MTTSADSTVDELAAANERIAVLEAELAQALSGMQEALNVVQEYQKVAIHPSDVAMFKHIANTLVRSMLAQDTPQASESEVTLTADEYLPCEVCGGGGWLLEPVEGYKPRRIRCKYCNGTGNEYGMPSKESRIEGDDIS